MFFPVIIGSAPRGKLGLLYTGSLLAFSLWILFFYVSPAMREIVDKTTPSMSTLHMNPLIMLSFNILGILLFIIGLILCRIFYI